MNINCFTKVADAIPLKDITGKSVELQQKRKTKTLKIQTTTRPF